MSDSSGNTTIPAGWYSDPAGSGQLRWWDGSRWSEHLHAGQDATTATTDADAGYADAATATHANAAGQANATGHPDASADASGFAARQDAARNDWYIWAIVLLPVLSIIALGFFDLTGYVLRSTAISERTTSPLAGMSLLLDPGYLIMMAIGWIVFGVTVVLAFLDWRTLQRAAIVRPFHWAWSFLGGFVYVIGRCVVVKSRTGRGLLPIWVMIAVGVLAIIVAVVKMVDAASALISIMPTAP